jgi:MerR family transcriptional regulator/heat shock protein HspR
MRALPRAEALLSIDELASSVGMSSVRLSTLVRLGIVEPVTANAPAFTAATAARLRRMLRLRRDLGVNLIGAAIILDLVDRLERTAVELERLRAGR